MASSKIKGITIEIGGETTKLGKALSGVESQTKGLQSELRGVNSLLKLDPKNVDLLKQKQELLTKAIEETKNKQELLTDTMKKIKSGEVEVTEEQFRDLQREIVSTEQSLERLTDEQKDFGSVSKQQLENVKKDFEGVTTKAVELGKKAAIGLAGLTTGAVAAVEATREMTQDFGKLQTTFQTTEHGADAATNTFKSMYGVLGENDTAIEASNLLAVMTKNEEDLNQWTNILTGVYATFGDSLPLEGLAEASNETAKVGEVTGSLADALNWAGISEDDFNEKLAKCNDEAEREKLIRETLTGIYEEASNTYKDINGDIIASNEAQAELNMQLSEATKNLEPLIEMGKSLLADILEALAPILEVLVDFIQNTLIPSVQDLIGKISELNTFYQENKGWIDNILIVLGIFTAALGVAAIAMNGMTIATTAWNVICGVGTAITTAFGTAMAFLTSPITLVVLAIAALIAIIVLLVKNWDTVKEAAINVWEKIKETFSNVGKWFGDKFTEAYNAIKSIFSNIASFFGGIWNTIKNTFSKLGTAIGDAISGAVKGAINSVISLVEGRINSFIRLINGAIGVINAIPGVEIKKISELKFPRLATGDVAEPNKPYFALLGDNKTQKEVISPVDTMHDTMMDALTDFVGARSTKTASMQQENTKLLSLFEKYLPIFAENMGYNIVLDDDTLVGKLTPKIDKGLGVLATSKRRGR